MSIDRHTPEDDANPQSEQEAAPASPDKPTTERAADIQLKPEPKASTGGRMSAQGEQLNDEQAEEKNTSTQKMPAAKQRKKISADAAKPASQVAVRAAGVKSAQSATAVPTNSVEMKSAESAKSVEAEPADVVEAKPVRPAGRKSVPAPPITPAPRPRFDRVVTPQQEEAARRLEPKRKRLRRGTDITPVVRSAGRQAQPLPAQSDEPTHHPSSSEEAVAEVTTVASVKKDLEVTKEKQTAATEEKPSEEAVAEMPTAAFAMEDLEVTKGKPVAATEEQLSEEAVAEMPTAAFALRDSEATKEMPPEEVVADMSAAAFAKDLPWETQKKQPAPELADVSTVTFAMKPAMARETQAAEADHKGLDTWRAQRQRKMLLRHISRKRMRGARLTRQRLANRVWLTVFSIALSLMAIFLTLTGASSFAVYQLYNSTTSEFAPQIVNLYNLMPKDNLKVYDSKGVLLDQLTDQGVHTTVPLSQISKQIVNAEISTEDKNFWTNPGIDIARIFQSAMDDLRYGHVVAGGSTITQQLIKNLVVGNEETLQRKVQEVMLTPIINDRYSKAQILEMYLNTVYYGEQAYGVDAAANIYYGIADQPGHPAAEKLDLAQSAMLAGIVSSPSAYDPLLHPKLAFERFDLVLHGMVVNGYITQAQVTAAAKEAHSPHFFKSPANMVDLAPHFDQFVLQQLEQSFHLTRAQLSRSDMKVYTTLDIGLQNKIQKIAQANIAALSANNVTNAAEVLIDFHTGAIISMLGSIDYYNKSIDGQFNVATAYRQPGSSFKPYVYVTAFQNGISPGQAIKDSPLTIQLPGDNPPTFSPHNYDLRYHGTMTLRCAIQNSLNVPSVKVLQHVGINNAMQMAYNMGVTTYTGTPGYSLVLGGLGVTLLEHTSAYGTFADGGVHVPYYAVQKVVFATTGQTIEHTASAGTQVISPQLAYMMTNVLSDNTDRIPEFFDCNVLQLYSNSQADCYAGNRGVVRPAAAKTGTTNDFRDNWTLGYTTDYVMGVWAGNDNNTPMLNVEGVQGAAPIWHDSMLLAEQGRPIQDFTNPGGLVKDTVTYPDGLRTTDWFLSDHVPTPTQSNNNNNNNNNNNDNNNNNNGGDNNNNNGGNTLIGNSNNGDALISMRSTLGSPLRKHPKHGDKGNNGDNGNGGAPFCPSDFSFTGGGASASGLTVW
jgi:membrane peptidoglycan carboxypeptidase